MFLTKVFRYNKLAFAAMLIFAVGQLFINFKRGMVITPFYNYGMYSEKFQANKSWGVWEVYQNGLSLNGADYSPQQWDQILLPVQYYAGIHRSNQLFRKDIKRLMNKAGLMPEEANFVQQCDYDQFIERYKQHLSRVTGVQTLEVVVTLKTYSFANGSAKNASPSIDLKQLCP